MLKKSLMRNLSTVVESLEGQWKEWQAKLDGKQDEVNKLKLYYENALEGMRQETIRIMEDNFAVREKECKIAIYA